jgi:hypothetical protein
MAARSSRSRRVWLGVIAALATYYVLGGPSGAGFVPPAAVCGRRSLPLLVLASGTSLLGPATAEAEAQRSMSAALQSGRPIVLEFSMPKS